MALVTINNQFGKGGAGLTDGTLATALRELQNSKEIVVAGAAANTDIAVAGLKKADTPISALAFASGVPSTVLASASIVNDGAIRFSVDTTGKTIVLTYLAKPV